MAGATVFRPAAFDDFNVDTVRDVVEHFKIRYRTHRQLVSLLRSGKDEEYVHLALGLTEDAGNYSAAEQRGHLGDRILYESSTKSVARFARSQLLGRRCTDLPAIVTTAGITWLKTSVGSEMMCMLRPESCWITNRRTVYVEFLRRNGDDWKRAAEAVEAIAPSGDVGDTYDYWAAMHPEIGETLRLLSQAGMTEFQMALRTARAVQAAQRAPFLWADAIASMIYEWSTWETA